MNPTLIAAIIAASAALINIWLQVRNAKRIDANRFHAINYERVKEERKRLLEIKIPEEFQFAPHRIGDDDEEVFLRTYWKVFTESAEAHCQSADLVLDAFDEDIRDVIESYVQDFRNATDTMDYCINHGYEDYLRESWETICYGHLAVNSIKQAMLTQVDRFADRLTGRKRRIHAYTHENFQEVFIPNKKIMKYLFPED